MAIIVGPTSLTLWPPTPPEAKKKPPLALASCEMERGHCHRKQKNAFGRERREGKVEGWRLKFFGEGGEKVEIGT